MASIRQIFLRRKAIDSIGRMTRTLEMISSARYKSYFGRWALTGEYRDALGRIAYLLATPERPIDHPLLTENASGRTALIAIGSRRGLCGSYNSEVFHLLKVHIEQAKARGRQLDIYVPRSRLEGVLTYHGIVPTRVYTDLDEMPTDPQIRTVAEEFVGQYMSGDIDSLGIVYKRFFSASSQQAQTLTILPLHDLVADLTMRAQVLWPWDLAFEDFYLSPAAGEIIEGLARMLVHYSIRSCFLDAVVSEHLARMIAMRNATDNAEDMIKQLTQDYNRARQTQITSELLDIVSGMGALE
ncbi:MAG: F0F1 ATP synthase subunit gamma [Sedimentisphaerales bacterium]|nr:F0F1 ATP synthase subunit gamma [Sedimentisphaerales bacterium]